MSAALTAQEPARATADLVQMALQQNRQLQAARQRVDEAKGLLRQAGVRAIPTVEVEGTSGRPFGTHGEQELSAGYFQPIETAGKRQKRTGVAEQGVALAQADVDARARQLVFDVKTRVAEWRAAQAKVEAIARLVTATQESIRLMTARVAEGDAAPLEEQLLVTELARAQAQRATLTGRAASALTDLRRVTGLTTGTAARTDEVTFDRALTLSDLTARALTARADLRAARIAAAQSAAAVALAGAEGVPDLTLFAKFTSRTSTFEQLFGFTSGGVLATLVDHDKVLSAGLSIPLFASRRNQGNLEAARAKEAAARLESAHLEATIPQEVEAAYQRWISARDTVALFRQGVMDRSAKNLDVIRQAYGLGQLRLLDVLSEQRRLIDTELAYVDAQAELAEAFADLERVIGVDL